MIEGIEFREADHVIVGHTSAARGKIADVCDKFGIASIGGWQSRKGPEAKWWVASEFTPTDYLRVKQALTKGD